MVAAGEGCDETAGVVRPLQGKGGELFHREVKTHDIGKKSSRFLGCKPQVCGTHIGQVAAGTEAGQRERWILTGDNQEVHLCWQVLKEKGQRFVNWPGINQV